jgi:hypothetical protein
MIPEKKSTEGQRPSVLFFSESSGKQDVFDRKLSKTSCFPDIIFARESSENLFSHRDASHQRLAGHEAHRHKHG